jgi:lauroyl/myristoyl acyltransferase
MLYWIWRAGIFLVGAVPQRISLAIARLMGRFAYYFMPLRRVIAQENFSRVLGKPPNDPEVGRVTRASFQNYACLMRDVMSYPNLSLADLKERITILHPERIEEALALGKGAIIVSAHFGNMDLAGAMLANQFGPIALVSETLRPQKLMDYFTRIRGDRKVNMHPYDRAPRALIQALKRNEMCALLIDFGITHHFDMKTVPVRFFQTETDFPASPAQFALLTGAAIVVGHADIKADGHIEVDVTSPIVIERTKDRQHDIEVVMQEIATRMEAFIRAHPEQWYTFRPMWKENPSAKRKIPSLSKVPSP